MFHLSLQWLMVAIDVSLKALLLAGAAALVLRLPRLADSNLRHRVWTGVLIGMLLLPALSQTVPALQLPFAIPDAWTIAAWEPAPLPQAAPPAPPIAVGAASTPLAPEFAQPPFAEFPADEEFAPGVAPFELEFDPEFAAAPPTDAHNPAAFNSADLDVDERAAPTTTLAPPATVRPSRWPVALLGLWLAGTCVMALRLLAGLLYSLRLVRCSTPITTAELIGLGVDPRSFSDHPRFLTSTPAAPSSRGASERKHATPIAECPLIRVPLALGVVRPRVLLPSDWPAWPAEKLQAVIAHERTHIERGDGAVIFLAEVNRCLYWFHPLAWWLRTHLGSLAETACDDAAIDATGDRTTYARHLLEVAATVSAHRSRLITPGISMARHSNVETRINTILDLTRPLSKRLTWTTTLLLAAALIPLITLAAAVRPSTGDTSVDIPEATAAVSTQEPTEPASNAVDAPDKPISLAAASGEPAAEKPPVEPQPEEPSPPASPEDDSQSLSVEGVVVGADGEPVSAATVPVSYSGHVTSSNGEPIADAQVWLAVASYDDEVSGSLQAVTTTDERGRFRFHLDAATIERLRKRGPFAQVLVATAADHGLDWLALDVFEDDAASSEQRDTLKGWIDKSQGAGRFAGRTLMLRPEERPVRGRLLDLEGHPLPNVTVYVEELHQPDIPLLMKAFREASKDGVYAAINATGVGVGDVSRSELQQFFPPVTTDKNGSFELTGIGDDQLVTLSFAGERVQAQTVRVLGRTIETVHVPHVPSYPNGTKEVYAGRDFTYAVGPSVPVEGVVKDFDTGEPIPRTVVYVERLFSEHGGAGEGQLRLDTRHMRTVTDERGRFRITGMPPGIGHVLEAVPPKSEPYLMALQDISLSLDDGDAKQIEIQVKQGIWIEGRVTDQHSGQGLSATVDYLALEKNPHTLDKMGLKQAWQFHRYRTDSEGRYRTLGLPGPGVVLVQAEGGYPRAYGAESVDGYQARKGGGYIPTNPIGLPLSNWNFIKQIDPDPDAPSFTCDIVLDGGRSIPGRVVGPDGKGIAGLSVIGEIANTTFWETRASNTFTVNGYDGAGPRQLFFKTTDETLVGQFRLEGDAREEIVVTLQPAVRVTGRLIENETDLPAARYSLHCDKSSLFNDKYPRTRFRIDDCLTDDEGRFEIDGLIAGLVYEMNAANDRHFVNNRNRFTIDLTDANPGDVLELGDVTGPNSTRSGTKPKRSDQTDARSDSTSPASSPLQASATPSADDLPGRAHSKTTICAGTVVNGNGQPVGVAHVAVIASRVQPRQGGDLSPGGEVLADGTSDASGRFRLVLDGVSGKSHRFANVIARREGAGMAWEPLNLDAPATDVSLQLRTEELIRGRLIDIDGQPAEQVRLSIWGLRKTSADRFPTDWTSYHGADEAPAAWIRPVTSDEQGRFTIPGVPAEYGVYLDVEGTERFAPQYIALNTGMPEHRDEQDGTYRPLVKNVQPGEEAVLALSPAQMFEGVVRYEDTGEPAPHARLTIWASQEEPIGSMVAVAGKADAEGRYRISPKPGIRFGVTAYPPDGVPYLPRRTPSDQGYRWEASDRVKQVDVTLPRGVLVKGTVSEAGSDKPVAGVSIQYIPESVNNDYDSDDILSGWQGIQLSDEDGRFEIAVLPGPGRLLAHGPNWEYVLQEIGSRVLSSSRPGGQRQYANAIERIDPEPDAETIDVTLELQRGVTVAGHVVDEQGAPIDEAVMITRLAIWPTIIEWRGSETFTAQGGRFKLNGLAEDQEYAVHFLDAERRLGATAVLRAGDKNPTVVLKPCGQAKMRIVDADGRPVADHYPTIEIVMTPGAYRFDSKAFQLGKLKADSDFMTNTDRTNYPRMPKSDERGEVLLPALIPGANYQVVISRGELFDIARKFQAQAGETLDLGDLVVEASE